MIAVDSSVAIAGFASWHERHPTATKILARRPRLVSHAAVETYSVLTRLPPPHRAQSRLVERFLQDRFPDELLGMPGDRYRDLITMLADKQILGGQTYDALIGLVAAAHQATLVSFDRRAGLIYEAIGARVELPD